jgi:hypothetical protein
VTVPAPRLEFSSRLSSSLPSPSVLLSRSTVDARCIGFKEGRALLALDLPLEHLQGFIGVLDGLKSLLAAAEIKARVKRAEVKAHNPEEITKSKEKSNRFDTLVCSVFDGFLSGGLDKKKAVAATNRKLKEMGEVSTYPVVEFVLRQNKKLSKKGSKIK